MTRAKFKVNSSGQVQFELTLSGFPVSAVSVVSGDGLEPSGLMSPTSTVRSLTRELQHSLDLASATSGDKVVTAQVSFLGHTQSCSCTQLAMFELNSRWMCVCRRMSVNRLRLSMKDKVQVLSDRAPTLEEN